MTLWSHLSRHSTSHKICIWFCLALFCCICCYQFRCSGTGKRYSNRKETRCLPLLNAGFERRVSDTKSPAAWMPASKPTELSRIKLKTWTHQPVPKVSEHSAHSTPLPVSWLPPLALAIYMFAVVDFDTLAQANVIRIDRRQVVFLCWRSTSHKICIWFCLALFCCS